MANIADYMCSLSSRAGAPPLVHACPVIPTAPWLGKDTKIRGFRLILVWLSVILLTWVLAGLLIYSGFKILSLLLS
jgi:hypothetical protein